MNPEDSILIDRYLNNELSEQELEAFLKRMDHNPDFKEQVHMEKQLFEALDEASWNYIEQEKSAEVKAYENLLSSNELSGLKDVISEANKVYQKSSTNKFGKWMFYSSAAIIVVFLSIYILWQPKSTPQELYAASIDLSDLPSLVTRGDAPSVGLVEAQQLFETAKYNEALVAFTNLQNPTATILLYKGITQMQLDDFETAEVTFNTLIESDFLDAEKGYWYKALLYLKKEDSENAKSQLETIISNKYYNYTKARDLIEKL